MLKNAKNRILYTVYRSAFSTQPCLGKNVADQSLYFNPISTGLCMKVSCTTKVGGGGEVDSTPPGFFHLFVSLEQQSNRKSTHRPIVTVTS